MENKMVKTVGTKIVLALFLAVSFVYGLLAGGSVFALNDESTAGQCLEESGGRDEISSVVWACNCGEDEGECRPASVKNYCSLWLSPYGDSTVVDLEINDLSQESYPVGLYGMCTKYPDMTSNIEISGDNGAIFGYGGNLMRGVWGEGPGNGMLAYINIPKFIEGLAPVNGVYTRTITIGRQNSAGGDLIEQEQTIRVKAGQTLAVKEVVVSRGWSVDNGGYEAVVRAAGGSATLLRTERKTMPINRGVSVSARTYDGRTLIGWCNSEGECWNSTSTTYYTPSVSGDATVYAVYGGEGDPVSLTMKRVKIRNDWNPGDANALGEVMGTVPSEGRMEMGEATGWGVWSGPVTVNIGTMHEHGGVRYVLVGFCAKYEDGVYRCTGRGNSFDGNYTVDSVYENLTAYAVYKGIPTIAAQRVFMSSGWNPRTDGTGTTYDSIKTRLDSGDSSVTRLGSGFYGAPIYVDGVEETRVVEDGAVITHYGVDAGYRYDPYVLIGWCAKAEWDTGAGSCYGYSGTSVYDDWIYVPGGQGIVVYAVYGVAPMMTIQRVLAPDDWDPSGWTYDMIRSRVESGEFSTLGYVTPIVDVTGRSEYIREVNGEMQCLEGSTYRCFKGDIEVVYDSQYTFSVVCNEFDGCGRDESTYSSSTYEYVYSIDDPFEVYAVYRRKPVLTVKRVIVGPEWRNSFGCIRMEPDGSGSDVCVDWASTSAFDIAIGAASNPSNLLEPAAFKSRETPGEITVGVGEGLKQIDRKDDKAYALAGYCSSERHIEDGKDVTCSEYNNPSEEPFVKGDYVDRPMVAYAVYAEQPVATLRRVKISSGDWINANTYNKVMDAAGREQDRLGDDIERAGLFGGEVTINYADGFGYSAVKDDKEYYFRGYCFEWVDEGGSTVRSCSAAGYDEEGNLTRPDELYNPSYTFEWLSESRMVYAVYTEGTSVTFKTVEVSDDWGVRDSSTWDENEFNYVRESGRSLGEDVVIGIGEFDEFEAPTYRGERFVAWCSIWSWQETGQCFPGGTTFDRTSIGSVVDSSLVVYAVYKTDAIPDFEGMASASSGGRTFTTDWQGRDSYKEGEIDCVSPTSCSVNFTLGIQRSEGVSGNTSYRILSGNDRWALNNEVRSGNGPAGSRNTWNFSPAIEPGEKLCYGIVFAPSAGDEGRVTETVCVTAKVVSLTMLAVNNAGTPLPNAESQQSWVREGVGTHSITVDGTINSGGRVFEFECFKADGGCLTEGVSGTTYTESITSSVTRYAVYKQRTSGGEPIAAPDGCLQASSSELVKMSVYNITTETGWKEKEVFAKPGDYIAHCASYNPYNGQYKYSDSVERNSSCGSISVFHQELSDWKNAFSVKFDQGLRVSARFRSPLQHFGNTDLTNPIHSYDGGVTAAQEVKNAHGEILIDDTAKTFDGRAETNTGDSGLQTTPTYSWINNSACPDNPHCCGYDDEGACTGTCYDYHSQSNVYKNHLSSTAGARVPYNFINTPRIDTPEGIDAEAFDDIKTNATEEAQRKKNTQHKIPSDVVLFAGETKDIYFEINTTPKDNEETKGTGDDAYATQVHQARWKLRVEYNGKKADTEDTFETLNRTDTEGSLFKKVKTITVPDVPAGTRVCVSAMVYPRDSGTDINWQRTGADEAWEAKYGGYNVRNDEHWAKSNPVCYVVAKKPNIQVWGGDINAASEDSEIDTILSEKTYVLDISQTNGGTIKYDADASHYGGRKKTFGSWGELGIISNGTIEGMASGAALGYPYGSEVGRKAEFCPLVPLTMGNYYSSGKWLSGTDFDCTITGELNKTSPSGTMLDVTAIKQKYIYEGDGNSSGSLTWFRTDKVESKALGIYKGNNVYYYYNDATDGEIKVGIEGGGGDEEEAAVLGVPKATTQVVHADKITVVSSLVYGNGAEESYKNFSAIPKLLLYAEKEVNINCNVARIDAVIVAPKVTTCADGSFGDEYTYTDGHEPGGSVTIPDVVCDGIEEEDEMMSETEHREMYSFCNGESEAGKNNQQARLRVNGSVITQELVANRTFGAGPGGASVEGGEVLNFDSTLYRWGTNSGNSKGSDDVEADDKLVTTYVKELAPRY